MVTALVETLSTFFHDVLDYIPPGLFLCIATAFIVERKYLTAFREEFVGTMLMIGFTFSAGKWIGENSISTAWAAHAMGVIAADFIGGGPQVNPAVTVSMWTLGKVSYTEAYVRIAAQMGGGLISFPMYHAISNAMNLTPFGGPEFKMADDEIHPVAAFLSEFTSMILLMFAIYILNWELNFGAYHYIIKQSLTALAIRALIEFFPTAGPAMNPMLATTWDVFGVGNKFEYPSDMNHYFVYWVAPCLGAIVASIVWTIYAGGEIFGMKLPIGPLKQPKVAATKKKD
jgi:glycerol uptake facilitator-like aquaporin